MSEAPSGVEKRLCELIATRQQQGVKSYGMTLEENQMPMIGRMRELLHELCDGAAYCLWIIEEMEKRERWRDVPPS